MTGELILTESDQNSLALLGVFYNACTIKWAMQPTPCLPDNGHLISPADIGSSQTASFAKRRLSFSTP
jgi:hypothetical protein